jgi:hypothetical protein
VSNPTSNFGWQMPTPTDLVTDLPADFEVFGQAVDSSLADLKGGTTGQVLSKNSNTDMDFVWVTDAAGDITGVTAGTGISGGGTSGTVTITNSMATEITAKGDLIVGTGSATFDNLAAGANGSTLVADSSTSTGLRYQSAYNGNAVINGGFDIWQRGTANMTGVSAYTADRWQKGGATSFGVSRQVTGDTTNLPNIQYCARVQRTSGSAVTSSMNIGYSMETSDSIRFVGQTVVVSFYARAGANFSATSSILDFGLYSGTGTDQNIMTTGLTGQLTVVQANKTLTTTWQRFTMTGTVSSAATQLALYINAAPTGTAGANDYYDITGVQLELGTVQTSFKRSNGSGGTLQGELAACQRYYFRNTGALTYFGSGGIAGSTTQCYVQVKSPTTMRVAPTTLDYSLLLLQYITGSVNVTSASISTANPDITVVLANTASGLTATTQSYMLMTQNNAAAYLGLSAEL